MIVARVFCLIACVASIMVGCERKPAVVEPRPSGPRVVVHSPAVGVIVRDLGRAEMVVGRHGHDIVLPRSLPVVGSQEGFDYEALLRARPTHVIAQWGSRELPTRLVEMSKANGWQLLDTRLLSLSDVRSDTVAVDAFLCAARGVMPPSAECTTLVERMDRAWTTRGEGFKELGRVLLLVSASPPAAFGPGSCHHEVLERIGGVPAITEGSAYIELDTERLLRIAPEVIVLVSPRGYGVEASEETRARGAAKLEALRGLRVPAVERGRVAVIDDPLAQLPSTSMIGFAEELAGVLEGMRAPSPRSTAP
ncbi:MAG TPA: ABC transporter substrate-binding protein [Phycisphaerales bacterium]|nr:ABC transporter substrate-binding protein [Phycisphaerales bacterium]